MALRWKYETWRKLYQREEGTFAQLPLYTRAIAAELIKFVDSHGRLPLGGRDPASAVAFQAGATRSDRRLLKRDIPALIADGYLEIDGEFLVIRNFTPAQEGRDRVATDPRRSNDGSTTEQRQGHDGSTTGSRQRNDSATKSRSTPRNSNGTEVALIPSLLPYVSGNKCDGSAPSESKPSTGSKRKPKPAKPKVAGYVEFIDHFQRRYQEHHDGAKPTWDQATGRLVKGLLKAHGLAECIRRADILFDSAPDWITSRDVKTLRQHFDKLAKPSRGRGGRAGKPSPGDIYQRALDLKARGE